MINMVPANQHPFVRFAAFSIDSSVIHLLLTLAGLDGAALLIQLSPNAPSLAVRAVSPVLPFAVLILVEMILLPTLGTTLGKAVMGLVLRRSDGRKLSFSQSVRRGV